MPAIECGRGHLYDPTLYPACPYCNRGKTTNIPKDFQAAPLNPILAVDSGKTLPPKGYEIKKAVVDENKTVALMKKALGIDPVVGWLVCVEGEDKGADYRIKGQINTIGRATEMDICIHRDKTISQNNHARLGYSEKQNRFTLIPAESKNIIYVNGEEVYTPVVLAAYDEIILGSTKLLFVPFCNDKTNWENLK